MTTTLLTDCLRSSACDTSDIPFASLHVTVETFEAHCRLIAATCHPIDLATFRDAHITHRVLPIPASMFVCSQPVRDQQLFWFDAVARAAGEEAVDAVRALPDEERPAAAAACDTRSAPSDPLAPMTSDQLRQLADEGFTIGAHTLESRTRQRVDALAIAERLGFTTAFTTKPDIARTREPALERSRFVMLAAVSAAELAHRMTYAWTR